MILQGVGPQLSDTDLDELEGVIGGKLPASFREFFLAQNGGDIVDDLDVGNSLMFGGFCQLLFLSHNLEASWPKKSTAEWHYHDMVDTCPESEGMLTFGYDWAGNSLMLSVREDSYDHVFLWDHEENRVLDTGFSFQEFVEEADRRYAAASQQ